MQDVAVEPSELGRAGHALCGIDSKQDMSDLGIDVVSLLCIEPHCSVDVGPRCCKKTLCLSIYPAHLDVLLLSLLGCVRIEANQELVSLFSSNNMRRCSAMYRTGS
jgi:hypothetical protein